MKKFIILFIVTSFAFACGNNEQNQDAENSSSKKQEKAENQKPKEETNKKPSDQLPKGEYEIKVGDDIYTGDNYKKGNTDFTYMYKGDESHVTIRIRNEDTDDNIMFSLYGSKEVIESPEGTYKSFMMGGQEGEGNEKANLVFMVDSMENPIFGSITMISGQVNVDELSDEGVIRFNFEGKGGNTQAIQDKSKAVDFSGEVYMETESIMKLGKDKKE